MNCPNCGYPIPEDSLFCQYCGVSLAENSITDPIVVEIDTEPLKRSNEINSEEHSSLVERESGGGGSDKIQAESSGLAFNEQSSESATTDVTVTGDTSHGTRRDSHKSVYCKKCGSLIDPVTRRCIGCGKQYARKHVVVYIVLAMFLVTSMALNALLYVKYSDLVNVSDYRLETITDLRNRIDLKEEQIADLDNELNRMYNKNSSLQKTVDSLTLESQSYEMICEEVESGSIGYASNNFKSSEGIIVVSTEEKDRKFTLTANWNNGGTVDVDYIGDSAYVTFDNDSWYTSTKMTIHPLREGVTIATFGNDVDSKTFKMIIIVRNKRLY